MAKLVKKNIKVPSAGPQPARILIVGEAPGKEEEEHVTPFYGSSGELLTSMLNEAGLLRTEIRVTNVCKYRPPWNKMDLWWSDKKRPIAGLERYEGQQFDPRVLEGLAELDEEIKRTDPTVIVPLGNLALWATSRNTGITKWRGSSLSYQGRKLIPTIHPAAILRKYDWKFLAVHDFRKIKRESLTPAYTFPAKNYAVRPTFEFACEVLDRLQALVNQAPTKLAVDIETRWQTIACIGIAWSRTDAICFPFLTQENPSGYYTLEQECELVTRLRALLSHPNALCIGQNWQYDYQYIARRWFFEVNLWLDIMSEHHVQFPGLPKGLDFQSSLYRPHHVYWKDAGKEQGKGSDDQWWRYNCDDCVATYEIAEVLLANRVQRPLKETQYGTPNEIQQRLSTPIARASLRGLKVNHQLRTRLAYELHERQVEREKYVEALLGHPLNPRSPKQMHELFYGDFAQEKILDRKTHKPTTDAEALAVIGKRSVVLRPLCDAIIAARSLANLRSFCLANLDIDGRFRSQLTVPGTETFRFTSSTDPLGFGTNAQNITSGEEDESAELQLPNLRKIFIPDEGKMMADFDMPQADARVVAWEAGDEELKAIFNDKTRDLHDENCRILFGAPPKSKDDIKRYYAKQGVHLTNYGGTDRVLAMTLGITVHEADKFQKTWFGAHPKIKQWHQKTLIQLSTRRYVENAYGYRRFYFDRMGDSLLKEALAWIPQSTVAIATNLGILAATDNQVFAKGGLDFLLQVHDSSLFQFPTWNKVWFTRELIKCMTVIVPYPDPLTFVPGVKVSEVSWGHCSKPEFKWM
jgi:DNA polymerase I-like protein with 3'-5' exonuclease and polymerase domains/uracil-DNA glycosylase